MVCSCVVLCFGIIYNPLIIYCYISSFDSILGSNFMRGHNVLFDIDNSRIGMAESTCDYKLLMTGEAEEEFMDPYPTRDEIMKS